MATTWSIPAATYTILASFTSSGMSRTSRPVVLILESPQMKTSPELFTPTVKLPKLSIMRMSSFRSPGTDSMLMVGWTFCWVTSV